MIRLNNRASWLITEEQCAIEPGAKQAVQSAEVDSQELIVDRNASQFRMGFPDSAFWPIASFYILPSAF
jgi:hypothetical protein